MRKKKKKSYWLARECRWLKNVADCRLHTEEPRRGRWGKAWSRKAELLGIENARDNMPKDSKVKMHPKHAIYWFGSDRVQMIWFDAETVLKGFYTTQTKVTRQPEPIPIFLPGLIQVGRVIGLIRTNVHH